MNTQKMMLYKPRTYAKNGEELVEPPERLKPCPFCGGEPVMFKVRGGYGCPGMQIRCIDCQTKGRVMVYDCVVWRSEEHEPGAKMEFRPYHEDEAKRDACIRWNRRSGEV